jgi:hypothetical protein
LSGQPQCKGGEEKQKCDASQKRISDFKPVV